LWSYYLSGSRDIGAASFHQVFQFRALARHQELRHRAIQPGLVELADRQAECAVQAVNTRIADMQHRG